MPVKPAYELVLHYSFDFSAKGRRLAPFDCAQDKFELALF
jgi:hypothetical protein